MSTTDSVKKAAELLRQGATMLDIPCPVCNMPLFRLKSGEVICPTHGKVYIVKDEAEQKRIQTNFLMDSLENILVNNVEKVAEKIKQDPMDTESITQIIRYLEAIERIMRIRNGLEKNKQ
ncbi:hypothetical protein SUSAZ_04070 [Sulfolobus acidocaldarius SUSAZ]|nr:hypothetical protein SUSAZ_04070 [Sulfolobus acidocaldarius SUSAZ]